MKMALLFSFFSYFFLLLCLTAECQELLQSLQLLPLQPPSAADALPSAAVHLEAQHLKNVSGSVLAAENWLGNHVFAPYPATNITTIGVGNAVLCNRYQHHISGLILPSIKNLYHSLTRWGLQEEIKVSAAFSSGCLDSVSKLTEVMSLSHCSSSCKKFPRRMQSNRLISLSHRRRRE